MPCLSLDMLYIYSPTDFFLHSLSLLFSFVGRVYVLWYNSVKWIQTCSWNRISLKRIYLVLIRYTTERHDF